MPHWESGTITTEHVHWFKCGECGWEWPNGISTQERAIREARRLGWSKTVAKGWICPDCAENPRRQGGEEE
uniref:Uncharacterized protein n=1 Tax=viral metagenome TaxID=1070528 RepID=A0A6M3M0D3_9ZZZZ